MWGLFGKKDETENKELENQSPSSSGRFGKNDIFNVIEDNTEKKLITHFNKLFFELLTKSSFDEALTFNINTHLKVAQYYYLICYQFEGEQTNPIATMYNDPFMNTASKIHMKPISDFWKKHEEKYAIEDISINFIGIFVKITKKTDGLLTNYSSSNSIIPSAPPIELYPNNGPYSPHGGFIPTVGNNVPPSPHQILMGVTASPPPLPQDYDERNQERYSRNKTIEDRGSRTKRRRSKSPSDDDESPPRPRESHNNRNRYNEKHVTKKLKTDYRHGHAVVPRASGNVSNLLNNNYSGMQHQNNGNLSFF